MYSAVGLPKLPQGHFLNTLFDFPSDYIALNHKLSWLYGYHFGQQLIIHVWLQDPGFAQFVKFSDCERQKAITPTTFPHCSFTKPSGIVK